MREPFPKFRLIVGVLLLSEIFLGLAIILATAAYQYILDTFMIQDQTEMLSSKFLNCYVLGFQLVAIYTCSTSMWKSVWTRRYSTGIQLLLTMWLFFCFIIVLCGCATIWSMFSSAQALTENVAMMLFRGIDVYYMNPEWKLLWDQLQYSRQCCGVNEYLDWMNASWMPKFNVAPGNSNYNTPEDYEHEIVESLRKLRSQSECNGSPECFHVSGKPSAHEEREFNKNEDRLKLGSEQTLAPYACCRHDSLECYQSYLPRPATSGGIPQLNLTEIYTRGCLPLFSQYMLWFMNVLLVLILAAILINIFLYCLTKYLMIKSYRNSYRELDNNISYFDDDGNALVVVKCPPKVRCITLEEQDSAWDSELPNICSDTDPCICCCDYDGDLNDVKPTKWTQRSEQAGRRDI